METLLRKQAKFFTWKVLLLATTFLTNLVRGLEEAEPAIYLRPRNFNPHPYQAGYTSDQDYPFQQSLDRYTSRSNGIDGISPTRNGPVVFPPSPPDPQGGSALPPVSPTARYQTLGPRDEHPYPKVAQKRRFKVPGKFRIQENAINPSVYEALSNHGAKVLTRPSSELGKDYTLSSLSNQKKDYAFSYKVVDHVSGDDFSHSQSQDHRRTNGEYRVKLPDGRLQIVSYTADKDGYKADVQYRADQENIVSHSSRAHIGHPNPVLGPQPDYYQYNDVDEYGGGAVHPTQLPIYDVLYSPISTPLSKIYASPSPSPYDGYATATPRPPLIYAKPATHDKPLHYGAHSALPQPRVEIYTNNNELTRLNNYVVTTAEPYYQHNDYLLPSNNVYFSSSTVAPTLDYETPPIFYVTKRPLHRK